MCLMTMQGPRHIRDKIINEKHQNITPKSNQEWFAQENIKKSSCHKFVCFVDFLAKDSQGAQRHFCRK